MIDLLFHNPPVVLYLLQAGTYGAAAAAVSRRGDHRALTICYLTSALLHGLLGACYLLRLG